jgi:hypothetical protein
MGWTGMDRPEIAFNAIDSHNTERSQADFAPISPFSYVGQESTKTEDILQKAIRSVSRRDRVKVARHEVPGMVRKKRPVPVGTVRCATCWSVTNIGLATRYYLSSDGSEAYTQSSCPSGTGSSCLSFQALRTWLLSFSPYGTQTLRFSTVC